MDRTGPLGHERIDALFGVLSCLIANIHRDPKTSPYDAYDFMPYHEKPEMTDEEIGKAIDRFLPNGNNLDT